MMCNNVHVRVEAQRAVLSHLGLGLANVLLVEQELTVQVAHVNGVQINLEITSLQYSFYSFNLTKNLDYLCQSIE